MKICSVDGCDKKSNARGLCKGHYYRWRTHGTTESNSMTHGTLAERLWRRVEKRGPDECWEWQGNRLPSGYGIIGRGGRGAGSMLTHRAAYEVTCEPIPDGLIVLHSCDNPPCCNPAHLKAGTYADNSADMAAKKRWKNKVRIGTDNPSAVLTPELVKYIRSQSHRMRTELSKELGIHVCTIRDVIVRRTWQHLP